MLKNCEKLLLCKNSSHCFDTKRQCFVYFSFENSCLIIKVMKSLRSKNRDQLLLLLNSKNGKFHSSKDFSAEDDV